MASKASTDDAMRRDARGRFIASNQEASVSNPDAMNESDSDSPARNREQKADAPQRATAVSKLAQPSEDQSRDSIRAGGVYFGGQGQQARETMPSQRGAADRRRRDQSESNDELTDLDDEDNDDKTNALRDAQAVVIETRAMVSSLIGRLDKLERLFGLKQPKETRKKPEASSTSKGKGIDPRNWGTVGIPDEELNENTQRMIQEQIQLANQFNEDNVSSISAALQRRSEQLSFEDNEIRRLEEQLALAKAKKHARTTAVNKGISTVPMSEPMEDLIQNLTRPSAVAPRAALDRPAAGVPEDSLLGQFMHRSGHDQEGERAPVRNEIYGPVARYKPLTPTAPDKYSGEPDVMKFLKYMTQCERFCEEAALPVRDQVSRCADSLTGKAYKFYTTMVMISNEQWDRQRFFKELYAYCFPPDFRLRQRRKLESFTQGNYTVHEYAAELTIMFRIIGNFTQSQRVQKLWDGLRPELQSALWREGLDYEANTWDEVIKIAARYEVAAKIEASERKAQREYTNYSRNFRGNMQNNTTIKEKRSEEDDDASEQGERDLGSEDNNSSRTAEAKNNSAVTPELHGIYSVYDAEMLAGLEMMLSCQRATRNIFPIQNPRTESNGPRGTAGDDGGVGKVAGATGVGGSMLLPFFDMINRSQLDSPKLGKGRYESYIGNYAVSDVHGGQALHSVTSSIPPCLSAACAAHPTVKGVYLSTYPRTKTKDGLMKGRHSTLPTSTTIDRIFKSSKAANKRVLKRD
ncbi:hypothetical protein D9613_012904 [Agrocybe pediades]|uniref:Retrotransposon gag domain-containing protein n=1 Tax=Agrocybe pediades TaxID=84607 RepID=A0A8H4QSJ5_9AGAR|nr:hypothetical protein D9613_012904 [Agrocybe pediades]